MEGFEIPIHRSLTQPVMIAGVPREIAILNGTFTAAFVLGLHSLIALPVGALFHGIAYRLAKHDPLFFQTFRRHIHHKRFYEA